MKCAPCLVDATAGLKSVPDAVTQISGTMLCEDCAKATSGAPGALLRDPAFRVRGMTKRHR